MENHIEIQEIREIGLSFGFEDIGAIRVEKIDIETYKTWISKGYNAGMHYLNKYIEIRENPSLLLENSKSIIVFLIPYNTLSTDNMENNKLKAASYSHYTDYHKAIKDSLYKVIHCIHERYPSFMARAFVDSAPILEKTIASKAALGWIGKNSLLISKNHGSRVLIGEIITNFTTDYTDKELIEDLCKGCNLCIKACPNHAILENKTIDARLCTSYHTIENKDIIPENIDLKTYIFGCDICLRACPWNKKEIITSKILSLNPNMQSLEEDINKGIIDIKAFNKAKKNSPISRIKLSKLIENINHNRTKAEVLPPYYEVDNP